MARKGQKFINYSVEFKLLAVKKYLRRQCFFLQLTDLLSCMGGELSDDFFNSDSFYNYSVSR